MAQSKNPSAESSPSGAGLEFRYSDDAWYDVKLSLQGEKLNIKYSMLSGSPEEEFHDARNFKSLDDVLRFQNRFRPLSAQVQDSECRNILPGVTVCASYPSSEDDLRYFDAVVEMVDYKAHSYKEGEEQCLCTFILFWQHGPGAGDLTSATVGDICLLTDGKIDQTLSAFIEMARTMVNHKSQSFNVAGELGNEKEIACNQGQVTGHEDKDSCEPHYQDTDAGGIDMKLKSMTGRYTYVVVIDNLEKDLTPLTAMEFILKETNINSQAHIFPSMLTDMYTRGVIEVNSKREFIELNNFLESTHQIIVSSHNRPWVMTERLLWHGEVRTIMPTSGGQQIHSARSLSELKVVRSGMPGYNMAKQLKENFIEFCSHGKRVVARLALEEQRIMSRGTTIN
ncbi:hypothetical protein QQ045_027259 [Rhodiola kirilowii]